MGSEDIYFESYRLISELGSGAFGVVYMAQHAILTNRIVAIKIMLPDYAENEKAIIHFFRESQFLEELKHPYILPIINAGIYNGLPYQVTEYASKASLRDRLKRQPTYPLPIAEAITILSQVGQALQYAHDRDIIHRDLKPENILFNDKCDAIVADFGIATMLSTSSIKHTNAIGTFQYMAPEEDDNLICKESDQYALGCIAYELFTGHLPFEASNVAAFFKKRLTEQPVAPRNYNPELPEHIEKAILKALGKQRIDRHANISAFITALITTSSGLSQVKMAPITKFVENAQQMHKIENGEEFDYDYDEERYQFFDPDYEEPDYFNNDDQLEYYSEDHPTDAKMFAIPKQASTTVPDITVALNEKGLILVQQEHFQEALAAFDQSLKLKPEQTSVWCYRGVVLWKLLRFSEALDAYKVTLELNPYFSPAYIGKGNVLLFLKQYNEALADFEQAITLDSNYADAWCRKGETLLELNRLDEALRAYEKALLLDSKSLDAYVVKGMV